MNQQERDTLVLDIAAIIASLADEDVASIRRAFALPGGREEFVGLLRGVYQLSPEIRAALLQRLKQQRAFTVRDANTA